MIDLLQLFLTHLQGYKRQAVWSPILIVVEVICELLLPLVMAEIVDTAIPAGDETYIFQLGAVMLVLAGVAMLCGVLAAKYSAFASQGFGAICASASSTRCRSSPLRTLTVSPPPPSSPV